MTTTRSHARPLPSLDALRSRTRGRCKVSKAEAIRRALSAGFEGPQEGTAYIRQEFGIEVAPQHFSATKSQIKSREGSKKQG